MIAPMRIVALLAAYNEEDIVDQVIAHLIDEGVEVYFLDDGSTDGTRRAAEARLGKGVIAVEALREAGDPGQFNWTRILARKEALAHELDAEWFIHHDADEFRESPWPGVPLADGIARVDAAGYNAIDFALFDFWPTSDEFTPDRDIRQVFRHYESSRPWNRLQVKCWKKEVDPVDLVSTGGHDAQFAGRRVYPLRFLLRHYPIRGCAHGRRKVFDERVPRFASAERARGWHCQYDEFAEGESFLRDASTMTLFDPVAARLAIATEDILELDEQREAAMSRGSDVAAHVEQVERDLASASAERSRLVEERAELQAALEESRRELHAAGQDLHDSRLQCDRVHQALEALAARHEHVRRELQSVYASRTWRWSRPLRALMGGFARR